MPSHRDRPPPDSSRRGRSRLTAANQRSNRDREYLRRFLETNNRLTPRRVLETPPSPPPEAFAAAATVSNQQNFSLVLGPLTVSDFNEEIAQNFSTMRTLPSILQIRFISQDSTGQQSSSTSQLTPQQAIVDEPIASRTRSRTRAIQARTTNNNNNEANATNSLMVSEMAESMDSLPAILREVFGTGNTLVRSLERFIVNLASGSEPFRGLTPEQIDQSTCVSFLEEVSEEKCSICISNIDDWTRVLPCSHMYHRGCIDQWLKDNNTCPSCRAVVAST